MTIECTRSAVPIYRLKEAHERHEMSNRKILFSVLSEPGQPK